MVYTQGPKMPKPEIEELVLHSIRNDNGKWVGEQFHKGCWIYMQFSAIGLHRVCRRGVLDQYWKGRLLGFKNKKVEGMVAIVQHVYSILNIHLCFEHERRSFILNCKIFYCIIMFLKIYVYLLLILSFSSYRYLPIYFN